MIPIYAIHVKAGLHDPCGPLPAETKLWLLCQPLTHCYPCSSSSWALTVLSSPGGDQIKQPSAKVWKLRIYPSQILIYYTTAATLLPLHVRAQCRGRRGKQKWMFCSCSTHLLPTLNRCFQWRFPTTSFDLSAVGACQRKEQSFWHSLSVNGQK